MRGTRRTRAASEVSDAAVARRLRYAMQDLGKPRTRRSDLAVFLDRSVQTPSPDLWRGILDNLDRSRFLIVLCSPRAAASDGVAREVQHWLDTGRSLDDLLVVLVDGSAQEALPAPLRRLRGDGRYDPLFVDLRWVRSARDLDSRTSSRFRGDVATLLAPIRGVAKETLVDEELTVRERGIRVQRRFIAGLSVATVVALLLGLAAALQSGRANEQARIAESRALAAGSQNQLSTRLDVAQLLAVEGFRRDDNLETRATLLRATLASPSLVRYLDAGAPIGVLTASTDGKTVVAGTETGALRQWSMDGEAAQARDLAGLARPVTAVATDGSGAAVAATDGRAVLVWPGDQPGAPVPLAPSDLAPSDKAAALGLSANGRWLVVALAAQEAFGKGALLLVDRSGAVPVRRLPVGWTRPPSPSPVTTRPSRSTTRACGSGCACRTGRRWARPSRASPACTTSPMPSPRTAGTSPGRTGRPTSPCGAPTTPPTPTVPISPPSRLAASPKNSPSRTAAGSSRWPTRARSRSRAPARRPPRQAARPS